MRRALLTALFITAVATGLSGCAWLSGGWFGSREVAVSFRDLNERLAKRFPVERDIASLLKVNLQRPRLAAATSPESAVLGSVSTTRLALTVDVDIRVPSLSGGKERVFWGSLTLSGVPRYDMARRAIFLDEALLDRIRIDNMPDALAAGVAKSASQIGREFFSNQPVHSLTEEQAARVARFVGSADNRPGIAATPPTLRIKVERDRLVLSAR